LNADVFIEFLKRLIISAKHSFFLIVDRGVWSKYWSEAFASSIENLICGDHRLGPLSLDRHVAQANVTNS
jgi:hypothetical protein